MLAIAHVIRDASATLVSLLPSLLPDFGSPNSRTRENSGFGERAGSRTKNLLIKSQAVVSKQSKLMLPRKNIL